MEGKGNRPEQLNLPYSSLIPQRRDRPLVMCQPHAGGAVGQSLEFQGLIPKRQPQAGVGSTLAWEFPGKMQGRQPQAGVEREQILLFRN